MMNKSCFKSPSKSLVMKKEEFEETLEEVVIMPMNKELQTRLIKSLFQQPFATNLLCFKDCLKVIWDRRMPLALLPICPSWTELSVAFHLPLQTQKIVSLQNKHTISLLLFTHLLDKQCLLCQSSILI